MLSEVAILRQQIDEVCFSLYQGLHGFAEVAKHERITSRYDRLGSYQARLSVHVGREQAFQEIVDALARSEKASETA